MFSIGEKPFHKDQRWKYIKHKAPHCFETPCVGTVL